VPDPARFYYKLDHLADVLNCFTTVPGVHRCSLFMQDYGGSTGF
jgi:hypothetical protein